MGKSLKTEFSGPDEPSVPLWKKLIYGSGDWGRASYNTLRQIFYAIFLTDVVGLAMSSVSIQDLPRLLRLSVSCGTPSMILSSGR